jgi:hypothetical protein
MVIRVIVVAVDVGELANIGWRRREASGKSSGGRDLYDLVEVVAADLGAGIPVALGFEAPLFIPRPAQAGS